MLSKKSISIAWRLGSVMPLNIFLMKGQFPETSIRPSLAFQYAVNPEFEYDYEVCDGENINVFLLIH